MEETSSSSGSDAIKRKRARAPNYTNREKETLLNVILDYKNIIENKKTDAVSVEDKKNAWIQIAEHFNSASPNMVFRSVDSLKKYYEHMKEDLRKRVGDSKAELYKTGGGSKIIIPQENTDDVLHSIINTKTVHGVDSNFDSNIRKENNEKKLWNIADYEVVLQEDPTENISENEERSVTEFETVLEVNYENEDTGEKKADENLAQPAQKWGKIKGDDLKTPRSKVIKENIKNTYSPSRNLKKKDFSRRRPTIVSALTSSKLGEKYELLIDKKLELVECYKKEHALRIQLLELDVALKKKHLLSSGIPSHKNSDESLVDSDIMF